VWFPACIDFNPCTEMKCNASGGCVPVPCCEGASCDDDGDDVQVIPVGQGAPNTDCVDTGADGISDTTVACDDAQVIPVGNGEPFETCIDDGGDGQLLTGPSGDDTTVGLTVSTGADGICDTFAVAPTTTGPSAMTSDVVVPVPSAYNADDLDEVRFHLKHP
jgi:hypothetical protein